MLGEKFAFRQKLKLEFQAQLDAARDRIAECYNLHGRQFRFPQDFYLRSFTLKNSGRVQEITFFDRDLPELKACLSDIIKSFQVSPFTDDDTLPGDVQGFRCRIFEPTARFELP